MTKLLATNEISAALFSNKITDRATAKADPKGYIFSRANIQLPADTSVSVVENENNKVHLTLPYYAGLEATNSRSLSEDAMSQASGGEIIFTIGAITTAAVWGGLGYGIDKARFPEKYNDDGTLRK